MENKNNDENRRYQDYIGDIYIKEGWKVIYKG
jgi:hypothetical protein